MVRRRVEQNPHRLFVKPYTSFCAREPRPPNTGHSTLATCMLIECTVHARRDTSHAQVHARTETRRGGVPPLSSTTFTHHLADFSYGRETPSPLPLPFSIASRVDPPAVSGGFREAFGSHANSRPPSHSGGSGKPRLVRVRVRVRVRMREAKAAIVARTNGGQLAGGASLRARGCGVWGRGAWSCA